VNEEEEEEESLFIANAMNEGGSERDPGVEETRPAVLHS
jgi:hypothetical protein